MPSCNSIRRSQLRTAKIASGVLIVAVAHFFTLLLLYRGRVTGRLQVDDFVLFLCPAIISWHAYVMVFHVVGRIATLMAFTLGFGAACLSCWAGIIAALNLYGS